MRLSYIICIAALFLGMGSLHAKELGSVPLTGVVNGGGGRGVFCADSNNVHHGKLLDLFEGEAVWRWMPLPRDWSLEESAAYLGNRYAEYALHPQANTTKETLARMVKDFLLEKGDVQYLPQGQRLRPVDDSFEPIVPEGCEIKQVAHFYADRILLIDRELWEQMRPIDQASLLMHEYLYFGMRREGHSDSRFTRYYVGKLASVSTLLSPFAPLSKVKQYYHCDVYFDPTNNADQARFEFYLYPHCKNGLCDTMAQFVRFNDLYVIDSDPIHMGHAFDSSNINSSWNGNGLSGGKINWVPMAFKYEFVTQEGGLFAKLQATDDQSGKVGFESKVKCDLIEIK